MFQLKKGTFNNDTFGAVNGLTELTDFVVELCHVHLHLLAVKPVVLAELADGPDQAQFSALREAFVNFNRAPASGAPVHD